jgi:hypothetical protein
VLVADSFVFVHIPKTGGSFVRAVISDHLPVIDSPAGKHTPYGDLPVEWQQLPGFYVVRNPWDWYVSWYHYRTRRGPREPPRNPGKRALWEGPLKRGEADFKEAVTRACTGSFDDPLAPMFREQDIDLYSARVKTIAGPALERPDFTAIRFERLRMELVRFLREHAEPPAELVAAIGNDPPRRASRHGHYQDYYDDELAELVGLRTRWLCERFRFEF